MISDNYIVRDSYKRTRVGRGSLRRGKHLAKSSCTQSTRHSSGKLSTNMASRPTMKHKNVLSELGNASKLFNDR